jgi:hypothetical protein
MQMHCIFVLFVNHHFPGLPASETHCIVKTACNTLKLLLKSCSIPVHVLAYMAIIKCYNSCGVEPAVLRLGLISSRICALVCYMCVVITTLNSLLYTVHQDATVYYYETLG